MKTDDLKLMRDAMNRLRAQASRAGAIQTSDVFRETDVVMDALYRAEAALSAAPAAEPQASWPVAVKSLVWKDSGTRALSAATGFGFYKVLERNQEIDFLTPGWRTPEGGWQYVETLDQAKAAAQDDFESRIRSALVQPAAEAVPVANDLAKRLCDLHDGLLDALQDASWFSTLNRNQVSEIAKLVLQAATAIEKASRPSAPSPKEADGLREALRKLITTARLLYQNSEGCAVNHYGEDYQLHGLPGWLEDCAKDIEAASAVLKREAGK